MSVPASVPDDPALSNRRRSLVRVRATFVGTLDDTTVDLGPPAEAAAVFQHVSDIPGTTAVVSGHSVRRLGQRGAIGQPLIEAPHLVRIVAFGRAEVRDVWLILACPSISEWSRGAGPRRAAGSYLAAQIVEVQPSIAARVQIPVQAVLIEPAAQAQVGPKLVYREVKAGRLRATRIARGAIWASTKTGSMNG